jgi:cytochrome c-type biogenesis protein CcmH
MPRPSIPKLQKMQTNPAPLAKLKQQIAQLDALIAEGVLTGEAARKSRDDLERQVLAAVLGGNNAPAPSGNPAASARSDAAPVQRDISAPRPSRRLVLTTAMFVLAFGFAGYAWLGNREGWNVAPGSAPSAPSADASEGAAPHSTQTEQIEAMIARLAARLKDKPDDADGWTMLARSYTAQGKHADALPAFKRAMELRPGDAQAIADYADGLAVVNNRSLEGEPAVLIDKAVKLDPKNVKALSLAGTVAFTKSDFKGAVGYWERAIAGSDPTSDFTRQLQGAMNEARERAGMPALAAAVSDSAPAPAATPTQAPTAAAGTAEISGHVSLDPKLKGQVGPDDTVFVFARAPSGSKMPLAIIRKKVSDLPLDFRLDESMAMSPAATLATVPQVVVGARVSKSGTAMPGPGDLQVLSAPVAVGTKGIKLEINEAVR